VSAKSKTAVVILTITDSVDKGLCDIVEPPICFIHSDSERLAMALIMFFGKLCDGNGFFVISDHVK
jgi:hypothetical protein